MPMPLPPNIKVKNSAKLTDNEAAFIIRTTLRPDQQEDPQIIKFIMEYLVCRSAPQAARAAGFEGKRGQYLRTRPEIHQCIQSMTEKSVLKLGYDATEVIERVKEIAGLDPIEFENPDGSYKTHMSQITPEARRAIKSFTVKNLWGEDPNGMKVVIGQLIKVELWDKLKSLELLGREKQIFKETRKIEHDVTANMAAVLLESKKRALEVDVTPQITGEVYGDPEEDDGSGTDQAVKVDSHE